MYRCCTIEILGPSVVKVDERRKLCITIPRFINYCNLYVAIGSKKESIETE